MKSRVEDAVKMFKDGYTCSQSVFVTYADLFEIDKETALKLSMPFGAGFGKLREVCGVVSGMTMLAGLKTGTADVSDREGKMKNYHMVQDMAAEFEKKNGTIICRELLQIEKGEDLPEPAVRTEEYYKSRPCARLVGEAAEIVENCVFPELFKSVE